MNQTGVTGPLTTRPKNVTMFHEFRCDASNLFITYLREFVEFQCGSNATQHGTDKLVPVDWRFSGDKDCIYCSGVLSHKYIGRYSVNASVVGEYTLRVENITKKDEGVYTCIDNAGFGPDEASAELTVVGKIAKVIINVNALQNAFEQIC